MIQIDERGAVVIEIVEFIKARIDEDELAAREATPGPWHALPQRADRAVYCVQAAAALNGLPALSIDSLRDAEHIARHDPARVLAEVAAKRKIIALHPSAGLLSAPSACESCVSVPGPCTTLRLLALPYAGHADYDADWAP